MSRTRGSLPAVRAEGGAGASAGAPAPRDPVTKPALTLLAVLLLLDAFVLAGEVGFHLSDEEPRLAGFASWRWNAQEDRSYAELLGYAQLAAAVLALAAVAVRDRVPLLAGWAVLLGAVVVDDAAAIHEQVGARLTRTADLPALVGLRPEDVGELIAWAVYGLVPGLLVLALHLRSAAPERRATPWLATGVGALVAAAVGLDVLHSAVAVPGSRTSLALGMLESAGELAAMSLLLVLSWVVSRAVAAGRAPPHPPRVALPVRTDDTSATGPRSPTVTGARPYRTRRRAAQTEETP